MRAPAAASRAPVSLRSRLANRVAQLSERVARSSRIFLLGLLVACGVEVVVDWNQTLFEINVLRDGMRQRGENYARILANTAVDLLLAYDTEALDRLCDGLFHDGEVIFVRFTDQQGTVMLDRLRDRYATAFLKRRKLPFREYYAKQLQRDISGILSDPEQLAQKMARSRHRDFVQTWNDAMDGLRDLVVGPPPPLVRQGGIVLYQDRLKDKKGRHEAEVTYALSTVADERGDDIGVVVVAFSMEEVNAQISKKYIKGLGMIVFFVGLILIQSTLSRREKLRLLELEARQKLTRQALRDALPAVTGDSIALGGVTVSGGLQQASVTLDGVAWDLLGPQELAGRDELLLLVVNPDGEGVSAVATALHVLRCFRRRCVSGPLPLDDFAGELAELGRAAMTIPLTRPLHLWLLRVDLQTGALSGVCGPLGATRVLLPAPAGERAAASVVELTATPLSTAAGETGETPEGLVGPLFSLSGELPPGAVLCGMFSGVGSKEERRDGEALALADYVQRARRGRAGLGEVAADASTWARGHLVGATGDLLVLLIARASE